MLFGLTAVAITTVAGPVVLVSAGIHRQERAGSLTSQPSGILALLAARVLGLHTCLPTDCQPNGSGVGLPAPIRRPARDAGSPAGPVRS